MTELSFPDMRNSSLEIYMNKCKENKAAATKWLHAIPPCHLLIVKNVIKTVVKL